MSNGLFGDTASVLFTCSVVVSSCLLISATVANASSCTFLSKLSFPSLRTTALQVDMSNIVR